MTDFESYLQKEIDTVVQKYTSALGSVDHIYILCIRDSHFYFTIEIPEKYNAINITILKKIREYWDNNGLLFVYLPLQKSARLLLSDERILDTMKRNTEKIILDATKRIHDDDIAKHYENFMENSGEFVEIMKFQIHLAYQGGFEDISKSIIEYWFNKGFICEFKKITPSSIHVMHCGIKLMLKPKKNELLS